jgi:RNA polymerase sigma factor (sigma-70 family)
MNSYLKNKLINDAAELLAPEKPGTSAKYTGISDGKIWDDFKNGDESAFIHIYSSHFRDLISFGYQFTSDKTLVEDCVQDLFVDLRRKCNKLSPIKSSIKLYLFQALKRRILDCRKKLEKFPFIDSNDDTSFEITMPHETHIINEQVYNENVSKLNAAINKLTVRQREALYYLYFNSMSYEEIKILMGLDNVKSARNLIYKAISSLKPYIEPSTIYLLFLQLLYLS